MSRGWPSMVGWRARGSLAFTHGATQGRLQSSVGLHSSRIVERANGGKAHGSTQNTAGAGVCGDGHWRSSAPTTFTTCFDICVLYFCLFALFFFVSPSFLSPFLSLPTIFFFILCLTCQVLGLLITPSRELWAGLLPHFVSFCFATGDT